MSLSGGISLAKPQVFQSANLTNTANTPGDQAAAESQRIAGEVAAQRIQPGQEAQYQTVAPQVKMPDFSALPQIQSFVPKIQEAGRLKLESGLAALRQGYGQQKEELDTQLAASGTYDAGDKYKLQQRMFADRASQESQLIYNIQAETLAQEVAELQRTGQISEERARMQMDFSFQKAIQEGNWQQATAIHNADIQMQLKTYNQQSLELENQLRMQGYDAQLKWIEAQVAQAEVELKTRGLDIEEDKLGVERDRTQVEENKVEVAALEQKMKMCVASHGENNAEVKACIDDARTEFNAYMDAYASGGEPPLRGDVNEEATPKLLPGSIHTDQEVIGSIAGEQLSPSFRSPGFLIDFNNLGRIEIGKRIDRNGVTYEKVGPNAWRVLST